MKEYRKPMITLIEFNVMDVLAGSAEAFEISWLNVLDKGGL